MNTTCNAHTRHRHQLLAFTLVEMLIAMAITLLMMAAVGRGFAYVGERVKDSRGNLQLSADLADITTRLRDELSRCTVNLVPNTGQPDQAGYFVYYEGPVTDATSTIFGAINDPDDPDPSNPTLTITPDSRYGDFDDYLAFTAIAPPGSWFTGKVPRYVLDRKNAEVTGTAYVLTTDAFEPVVIRSRYAEIVYFVNPEYAMNDLPARQPAYLDVDGQPGGDAVPGNDANGFPDRMFLYRRVLLIRPDLNLSNSSGDTFLPSSPQDDTNFLTADAWPSANTAELTPLANSVPGLDDDGWIYGMAKAHQRCDLSIRRVLGPNGLPLGNIAANSLEDLAKPHNRFAHIRVPASALGGSNFTSMPLIALGPPPTILEAETVNSGDRIAPDGTGTVITPQTLCGFLRPEFVLGSDWVHFVKDDPSGYGGWSNDRSGEDIVVNNILGFDLKIYDPSSTSLTTDSGFVISPNDAGYRETLIDALTSTTPPTPSQNRGELRGDFVDLSYPVLAGGSLRGWQQRFLDSQNRAGALSGTISEPTDNSLKYLITPYSGLSNYSSPTIGPHQAYANSLYRSGKLLITGGEIRLFQPTFDTYTSSYERDGFLQNRQSVTDEGIIWRTTTTAADSGSDGVDGFGIYTPGMPAVDSQFGADDLGEHETLPPFTTPAEAIQISVRLYNPSTRQIKQMSVVHRGKR